MKTNNSTRDRLLEAGLREFSKKGYLGATTREIAKEAGIAEVTLFRHFPSKEKLFEEVINTYTFLPALKGLLPELKGTDYRDALCEIARRFLERLSERRELVKIMLAEIHLYPAEVRKIYRNFVDEMFRTLASYFEELQSKGILKGFHPELGARAFMGMFFSYFNAREFLTHAEFPYSSEDVIMEYVGIFAGGTLAPDRRERAAGRDRRDSSRAKGKSTT